MDSKPSLVVGTEDTPTLDPVGLDIATFIENTKVVGEYWQQYLRLQDWDISYQIVRASQFDSFTCLGTCETFPASRAATIRLLHPVDIPVAVEKWGEEARDFELTLVHELLHIHLSPWKTGADGSLDGIAQEQAINAISRALVRLDREAHCPTQPADPSSSPDSGHYF